MSNVNHTQGSNTQGSNQSNQGKLYNPKCNACTLGRGKIRCIPGFGVQPAPIVLITDLPIGVKDWAFLQGRLAEIALSDKVFVTSVCKCKTTRSISMDEVNTCYDLYLRKELELCNPKVLILFGVAMPFIRQSTITAPNITACRTHVASDLKLKMVLAQARSYL